MPPPQKELVIMDGRVGNLGIFLLRHWNYYDVYEHTDTMLSFTLILVIEQDCD
jgi:hypothetical protein